MVERTPSLASVIQQALDDRLADVHVMLPGRIESYDAAKQKADVKPLLRRVQRTVDGDLNEPLPVITAVPVAWPRVGQYRITMPVAAGSRCALVFCERSIDNYQIGSGGDTNPESYQMHDLTDPIAIMGWYPDSDTLDPTDSEDMVIGHQSEPSIHLGRDLVNLYEKNAADFLAKAQKTLDELQVAQQNAQAVLSYAQQIGGVFAQGIPVPQDGGAALQTAWIAGVAAITPPTLTDPQSVATEKVKGT